MIYIPKGKYLIGYKGDDTGGVYVNIRLNTTILCDPEAIFIGDNVDNDMIRFTIPANLNINVTWRGGIFHQFKQKCSTTYPFSTTYPSNNQGKSATCDALTIYSNGLTIFTFEEIQFYAVDNTGKSDEELHWINSGGDGALFVDNVKDLTIRNCKFVGSRDCGIYTSKASNSILIENNRVINCFHGITGKRGVTNVTIRNNYIHNCVRGIAIQHIDTYNDASNIIIKDNVESKCNVFIQVQRTNIFDISNNVFTSLGSTFPNGNIIPEPGVVVGIDIDNSKNGNIKNNTVTGLTNGVTNHIGLYRTINGSTNNTFENNTITY